MRKSLIKAAAIQLAAYSLIPVVNRLFPGSVIYTFLSDLWLLNPLAALATSVYMGRKCGFCWWYALVVAGLFIPTMFLFYNESAAVFGAVYALVSLIGCGIGAFIYKQKRKKGQ